MDEIVLLITVCAVFTFFFALVISLALRWLLDRHVLRRLESCEMTVKNARMQDVKLDKQQKVNLALLRMKELADAKTGWLEIGKTIAVEYPDVCIDALRKGEKLAKELGLHPD